MRLFRTNLNSRGFATAGTFDVKPYNTMPQSTFAGRVIATSMTQGTFELMNDDLVLPLPLNYNLNKAARMWNKNGFVVKGDPDINTLPQDNTPDQVERR